MRHEARGMRRMHLYIYVDWLSYVGSCNSIIWHQLNVGLFKFNYASSSVENHSPNKMTNNLRFVQPTQTIVQIVHKARAAFVSVCAQIKIATVTGNWHSQKRCNSIHMWMCSTEWHRIYRSEMN